MAISHADTNALTSSEHQVQLRRAVIASTIGTAIEWYDFFLYSTVTGLVFAKLFFPHSDPWVGTLEAFAIYAVGFLARPVGAAIFGHYGDRIGRKSTLIATLLLMGLATFAVALTVIRQYPKQILLSAFARMAEQAPFYIFTAFIFNDDRLHRQGHFGRISVAVTRGAAPVAMVAI
jgi:MFS family permease